MQRRKIILLERPFFRWSSFPDNQNVDDYWSSFFFGPSFLPGPDNKTKSPAKI